MEIKEPANQNNQRSDGISMGDAFAFIAAMDQGAAGLTSAQTREAAVKLRMAEAGMADGVCKKSEPSGEALVM
jgi:hypothetical protein